MTPRDRAIVDYIAAKVGRAFESDRVGRGTVSERCIACRHWQQRNGDQSGLWESAAEEAVERPAFEEWGLCKLAESDNGEPTTSMTMAIARDYESYRADLLTFKDFGCVQWELKADG